jgi:hypothetical protein
MDNYIYSSDGIKIKVPETPDAVEVTRNNDGSAIVAKWATPQQVANYYRAARNQNIDFAWGDVYHADAFHPSTFVGDDYDSSHEFRYDQKFNVDPDDQIPRTAKAKIAFLRDAYDNVDTLVKGIVDVLTELTAGRVHLEGGSPELREQFMEWYRLIDVQDLVEQIAWEYWISGNVIINTMSIRNTKKSTPFTRRELLSDTGSLLFLANSLLDKDDDRDRVIMRALLARFQETPTVQESRAATMIPMSYSILDPLTLKAKGNPKDPTYAMTIDQRIRKEIRDGRAGGQRALEALIRKFGDLFVEDALTNQKEGRLDADRIRTIYNKKPHYRFWGYPPGAPAVPFIQLKRRYRDMNLNTASQAIAYIILFKVGNDQFPVQDESELKSVAQVWGTRPRKNPAAALFQPHTTSIEIITPPDSAMQMLEAGLYDNPNMQIAQSWGVNLGVITGLAKGTVSYATANISIRPTIRRVIIAHMKMEDFLNNEHIAIGDMLGYDRSEIPRAKFLGTGLENIAEIGALFQAATDRGGPMKYMFESLNLKFDDVVEQARLEQEMDLDEIFPLRGSPNNAPGQTPTDSGPQPGVNTPDPNREEDTPERKTDGSLDEVYEELRDQMEAE